MSESPSNILISKLRKLSIPGITSLTRIEILKSNEIVNLFYDLSIKWNPYYGNIYTEKTKEKYICVKGALRAMDCGHLIPKIKDIRSVNTSIKSRKIIIKILLIMLDKLETRFIDFYKRTNWPKPREKRIDDISLNIQNNYSTLKSNFLTKEKKINSSSVLKDLKIAHLKKRIQFSIKMKKKNFWKNINLNRVRDFLPLTTNLMKSRRKQKISVRKSETFRKNLRLIDSTYKQTFEIIGVSSVLLRSFYGKQLKRIFNLICRRLQNYKISFVSDPIRLLWTISCPISNNQWDKIRYKIQLTMTKIKACRTPDLDPTIVNAIQESTCEIIIKDIDLQF